MKLFTSVFFILNLGCVFMWAVKIANNDIHMIQIFILALNVVASASLLLTVLKQNHEQH